MEENRDSLGGIEEGKLFDSEPGVAGWWGLLFYIGLGQRRRKT